MRPRSIALWPVRPADLTQSLALSRLPFASFPPPTANFFTRSLAQPSISPRASKAACERGALGALVRALFRRSVYFASLAWLGLARLGLLRALVRREHNLEVGGKVARREANLSHFQAGRKQREAAQRSQSALCLAPLLLLARLMA